MPSAIAAVAVAHLALAGWGRHQGSGTLKEEARTVGEIHGVEVSSGIHATVRLGPKVQVTLKGDDNLLPLVKLEVDDGVLSTSVDGKGSFEPSQPIQLTVVLPKLDHVGVSGGSKLDAAAGATARFEVEASGGGEVRVAGLAADRIEVDASGGSEVRLAGKGSKDLELEMSGGAKLRIELPTERLHVEGSGGSEAHVQVSSELEADLSGGAVTYVKGRPSKRKVDTSGGAEVRLE